MPENNQVVNVVLYEMNSDMTVKPYLMVLQCIPGLDVYKAIRDAAADYLKSPAGKETLKRTSGFFNHVDFAENVTPEFTTPHGFVIVSTDMSDVVSVDANDSLIQED